MSWDEERNLPTRWQRCKNQLHRIRLGLRIASEVSRSGVEPGKVAWISVDSNGAVHVAPSRVSERMSRDLKYGAIVPGDGKCGPANVVLKANTKVLKLTGSAESIR